MISRFLGALQFLTVLPIRGATAAPGAAAVFFPAVGALLGLAAAGVLASLRGVLGPPIAALLAILFLVVATGGLHEDGLADVADAFRSGRTRDRIFSILKDSRIGSYGGIAIVFSVVLRWQALAASPFVSWPGVVAALALSRTALVWLAFTTPAVGEGLGVLFKWDITPSIATLALLQALAIAMLFGRVRGIAMFAVSAVIVGLARRYFLRHLGGVNGDCLGATCQIVESANLLVLAWRFSS